MTVINILCCYYVHGLDGSNRDFKRIKEKVEGTFQTLFTTNPKEPDQETGQKTINVHYGYCSNDNALWRTHAAYPVLVDKSFRELNQFLETSVLPSFQQDYAEYLKERDSSSTQCHLYFSIIGHSLGGIISRGVVHRLFSSPYTKDTTTTTTNTTMNTDSSSSTTSTSFENYLEYLKSSFPFLTSIQPCTFLTLSTPHLGSLACNESGGLVKFTEKTTIRMYCNYLSGHVGKIFTYKDGQGEAKPTLIQLSQKEYMEAYAQFPNRTLIGCIRFDLPVKFCSAMGNIDHPVETYGRDHQLVEENQADTQICSYAGYAEESDDVQSFYDRELFNSTTSGGMFREGRSKQVPSPDISQQIKEGLEKIHYQPSGDKEIPYEEMETVFIPDTINQVEVAVSALKRFNEISFRRIIFDFALPKLVRFGTHATYIGNVIVPNTSTVEAMVTKTTTFISHLILADYLWTSKQSTSYSLNDLFPSKEAATAEAEKE